MTDPERERWMSFLATVQKCRAAQKRYFRQRDNLTECKGLEAAVDEQAEILSGQRTPGLFDRPPADPYEEAHP